MGTLASCYCTDEMKEIPNKRVCSFTIFRIKREMQGQLFYYCKCYSLSRDKLEEKK